MEIIDRELWERELTDHLRQHATDLRHPRPAVTISGVRLSTLIPILALWSVVTVTLIAAGWMIGLYFI